MLDILVYGEGRDKIIAALGELLPVWEDNMDENDDKSLYRRTLQTAEYSPALHRQILNRLNSADTENRQLALACISALIWPQFRPHIEKALKTVEDDGLQRGLLLLNDYLSYEQELNSACRQIARTINPPDSAVDGQYQNNEG